MCLMRGALLAHQRCAVVPGRHFGVCIGLRRCRGIAPDQPAVADDLVQMSSLRREFFAQLRHQGGQQGSLGCVRVVHCDPDERSLGCRLEVQVPWGPLRRGAKEPFGRSAGKCDKLLRIRKRRFDRRDRHGEYLLRGWRNDRYRRRHRHRRSRQRHVPDRLMSGVRARYR